MKKEYQSPSAKLQTLNLSDVITASLEVLYKTEGEGDKLGYGEW